MQQRTPDTKAYQRVVAVFKKHKKGITLSDVAAGTGLGLHEVKALVPAAADEYSGRLEVTGSGEILYSFPHGFSSRYRGLIPACKRGFSAFKRHGAAVLTFLFKAWIMVMLVGYFLLFIAIALAALVLSIAAKNNRQGGGSGAGLSFGIFHLIIRMWFYSELFNAASGRGAWGGGGRWGSAPPPKKNRRPMHKAIFSFIFGDGDPNSDRETIEKKEFIAYLRRQRGVVSLPELMILTGQNPQMAESYIMRLCAEFGGTPEVTEEGTIVYRFEEILYSSAKDAQQSSAGISTLYKKPRSFSANPQKMNFWFSVINGVNLLFGGYFLHSAATVGHFLPVVVDGGLQIPAEVPGIYGMVYSFLLIAEINPLPIISIGLGLVPLLFSAFFWLIPALRWYFLKKENEKIRTDNFRGLFFGRVWASPDNFKPAAFDPREDQSRPGDVAAAKNSALKEIGAYSTPQVSIDEGRNEVFAFTELRREKDALAKYRRGVDVSKTSTGDTVFDSNA
ncbi:MAG: hypothetical protein FWB82_05860 [Treponema sp.]|nr:hypothetical protein [Treponema sp.]